MTSRELPAEPKVLALCGGVGGAKLAWGLAQSLPPEQLLIAVNTGDDFEHLGLHISPDLDTVMYTLAGVNNRELGWGLAGETWQCMQALEHLGGETWFRLGDQDIATHLQRSNLLRTGVSLSDVTTRLHESLGVAHAIVPMSDDAVRTLVDTDEGCLPFQQYFVRRQCQPVVKAVQFAGAENARPNERLLAWLQDPSLTHIVICPSNPLLSIAPILAVPGMRAALQYSSARKIVVSPLVGGDAVKGPTAKMMRELQMPLNSLAIAETYRDLLDILVIDECDRADESRLLAAGYAAHVCRTLMKTDDDKRALAETVLSLA